MQSPSDPDLRAALEDAYEEVTAYYDELGGESSRAAAILLATRLEDEVERLIRREFKAAHDNDKLWKKIAGPGRPLGSAQSKIDAAEAFGIISEQTRKLIEIIFRVRNRFAHNIEARDFADPIVKNLCELLSETSETDIEFDPSYSAIEARSFFVSQSEVILQKLRSLPSVLIEDIAPQ